MSYNDIFKEKLEKLKKENLLRSILQIEVGAEKYININGKRCLNLSSNNYLGLSRNSKLIDATKRAVLRYGCSSSASRLVTGNYSIYDELEKKLAEFKNYEKCLVLGCGYVANVSIIPAITDKEWTIFSDELNHASIIDGVRLSSAHRRIYRHNDTDHLEKLLKECQTKEKLIITDTVFSMDGDVAKLKEIAVLAKRYNALVMVDEAHATGIFGKGRGMVHELGLENEIHINMGTFSKALGSYGAYVCSSKIVIDYLINRARGFIYSTSLPPSVIGANLEAIKFVKENPDISTYLIDISKVVRRNLRNIGFDTLNSQTQIIPVIIGDRKKLLRIRDFLIEKGIYAVAIRPPTVPLKTDRLRLSLRADLTMDEIEFLISSFEKVSKYF